jgi:hypothetical protein
MDFGGKLIVPLFSKPHCDNLEKSNVIMRSLLLIICLMLLIVLSSTLHKCGENFKTK